MQTRPVTGFGSRRLFRSLGLPAMVLAVFWGGAALPAQAATTLITYWDFNNGNPNVNGSTLGKLNAADDLHNGETYNETVAGAAGILNSNNLGSRSGTLTLSMVGQYGVATSTSPSWGLWNGTTTNLATGDATAGNSLFMEGKSTSGSDSLLFNLSGTGYSGLTFTFGERLSSTNNTPTVTWYINTTNDANLANWTVLTTSGSPGNGGSSYGLMSLSLPGTFDNSSQFYLKAVVDFSTSASGNSFAIDNVQFSGTAAVPEPSAVALLAFGAGAVLWRLRRRPALA